MTDICLRCAKPITDKVRIYQINRDILCSNKCFCIISREKWDEIKIGMANKNRDNRQKWE
jgi:hypothetical protein